MNGLSVMAVSYVVLTLVVVVGIFRPTKQMVALVRLCFALAFSVVLCVMVWYLALMVFYYFNGGVAP